jgi:pimeloyl-ACP methyl ester carboxylesterase
VVLALAGAIYQTVATEFDKRAYPPPGQLVDVGGYRLHLYCVGTGTPTAILESGLATPAPVWAWVQPAVATATRVCAYDRADVGWSDPGPAPRDARQIARELHALLGAAGVAGPYVLVGHSYGGKYVRVYAADYPTEVAGMVLVDTSHPDQWTSTPAGQAQYKQIEQVNAIFRLLAPLGILRAINYFPPSRELPARQSAETKAFLDSTRVAASNAAEFGATPATDAQVRAAGTLGARPLVVLTATDHGYQGSAANSSVSEQNQQMEQQWQAWQRDLTTLSSNSVQQVVEGASHVSLQMNQEHAKLTSAAIIQVVDAVRTGQPLAR